MLQEPIYITFETKEGFHVEVEQPWWVRKAFTLPGYCCEGTCCARFIDLPCRMCKFSKDEYARPIHMKKYSGYFVNVLLTLRHWGLAKRLVDHIVRNYIVLSCPVLFKCPYLYDYKTKNVMHSHCYFDGLMHSHCYDDNSSSDEDDGDDFDLHDTACAILKYKK